MQVTHKGSVQTSDSESSSRVTQNHRCGGDSDEVGGDSDSKDEGSGNSDDGSGGKNKGSGSDGEGSGGEGGVGMMDPNKVILVAR